MPAQEMPADTFRTLRKGNKITPADMIRQFEAPAVTAYTLEPGDEITVTVWNRPELSGTQTIGPDGKITIPLSGPLKIAGLTREDCQDAIKRALVSYYPDIAVTLRVDHYSSFQIFVLGRVGTPGALNFDKQPTLLEVLTRAAGLPIGGIGADKAGLVRCAIFRGQDKIVWIDLKELLSQGNLSLNIRLGRRDLVYLPDADDQLVYVLGNVKSPGAFRLTPAMSFLDALSLAGGPTDDASVSKIAVVRASSGEKRQVAMRDLLAGKAELNYSLEEGDIIYVPRRGLASFGYVLQKVSSITGFAILGTAVAK